MLVLRSLEAPDTEALSKGQVLSEISAVPARSGDIAVGGVATAAPKVRIAWFDGVRGYLLLMMYFAHYCLTLWTPVLYAHHMSWLPVADGEFFVLISGLVCAIAYAGPYQKTGAVGAFKAVLSRLKWVYLAQIAASVIVILMFRAFGEPSWRLGHMADWKTPLFDQFLAAFTLRQSPPYLNILILYITLMLFIPLAYMAIRRGWKWRYFAVLVALWFAAHFNLDAWLNDQIRSVFDYKQYFKVRGYFSPVSYACVFYTGFFIGYQIRQKKNLAEEGLIRLRLSWFLVSVAVMAGFAVAAHLSRMGMLPKVIWDPPRDEISLQGLVVTAVASYAIWYLIAKQHVSRVLDRLGAGVRWICMLRPLQLLGKNSLFVYSMHIPIMYFAAYLVVIAGLFDVFPARVAGLFIGAGLLLVATLIKARIQRWIYSEPFKKAEPA